MIVVVVICHVFHAPTVPSAAGAGGASALASALGSGLGSAFGGGGTGLDMMGTAKRSKLRRRPSMSEHTKAGSAVKGNAS